MRMGEMKLIIGGPGDSRTLERPELCIPPAPAPAGYTAPCPTRDFVVGCVFACGSQSNNCELCFGNGTEPALKTPTASACQAACEANPKCGAFQWIGGGVNQCLLKCPGAVTPGRTQCSLGHKVGEFGGNYVCGPKHNNSNAPAPVGPPPTQPPSPGVTCPVPFGLSSGHIEEGTDHARADGLKGTRTDLVCKPWCLFNLTSDIGERNDLGQNPAYQDIAKKIAARLQYHGSTGPMPAYIWPADQFKEKANEQCLQSLKSGYVEPIDADVTLLDARAVL